jgi:hypothetical protein
MIASLRGGVFAGLIAVTSADAQWWSAQAVPAITHAAPTVDGRRMTEAFVSQPVVGIHASRGAFAITGMVNLEGLTIPGGELNTGAHGEGFVDRRHPHTYLHELVASAQMEMRGHALSLSVGRGFVPFGSDDPMSRPFFKFPVNHHIAQVLERLVLVGAVRRTWLTVEAATFGGDEPTSPSSLSRLDRFGDSWSVRATVRPARGAELSMSRGLVRSPEVPFGGGLDHLKSSVVLRYQGTAGRLPVYALGEWGRSDERDDGARAHRADSWLGEVAGCRGRSLVGVRLERTDRLEHERLLDPFRTASPPTDFNILGVTSFTTLTVTAATRRGLSGRRIGIGPFIEAALVAPRARDRRSIAQPSDMYRSESLWMLSVGARISAGPRHRMGRYGAAADREGSHLHAHDGMRAAPATECTAW